MNGWQSLKIGDITENFDSKRIPIREKDRISGSYPYYGASGIVDYVQDFIFDGYFILVAEDGENLRSRKTPIAFPANGKFWVNNHAHIVQGNVFADTKFIGYLIESTDISGFLTGSTIPKLTQKNLNDIPVMVPPFSEQKAIAHILGTLDDKIELNQKMNQTLEDIAKAIFKSWFVDFNPVRAKMEGKPTGLPPEIDELFPDELVDSEIGEIPKGWEVLKVKDEAIRLKVGKLYSNKTVEEAGSIPVLDQSDVGIIGYHSNEEFGSASFENQVFTVANHTCKMRLLFSDFGVIQNVIPIQSKSYPTIWFYLRTLGIKQFEEYKGHIPDFMDTQLCFPSVQLAKSLNQLVTPLFHNIEIANRENKVLIELRDVLLPKLISGELRIPDAEKFLEEAGI